MADQAIVLSLPDEGALRQGSAVPERNHGEPASLAEIGNTKKQSHVAQKLADIPANKFRGRIEVVKARGELYCTFVQYILVVRYEHYASKKGLTAVLLSLTAQKYVSTFLC